MIYAGESAGVQDAGQQVLRQADQRFPLPCGEAELPLRFLVSTFLYSLLPYRWHGRRTCLALIGLPTNYVRGRAEARKNLFGRKRAVVSWT